MTNMANQKHDLSNTDLELLKDEFVITDPKTGEKVPLKLALGRRQIKVENSLLYSIMLFGTLSDDQLNEFVRINTGKMTQNDKIAHYLYQQASQRDKDAINSLIELNVAIAKRDKTTIINFAGDATLVQDKADSIIDRLEADLAQITEGETVDKAQSTLPSTAANEDVDRPVTPPSD